MGDRHTGLVLDRVVVEGDHMDAAQKYACPSHGIALTRDEKELWLADGVQNRLHVFDATMYPPTPSTSIEVRTQPRWIAFSIDGRYAYPSTGDVIDALHKNVVTTLEDDRGIPVQSEKLLEIDFVDRVSVDAGSSVGIGGVR